MNDITIIIIYILIILTFLFIIPTIFKLVLRFITGYISGWHKLSNEFPSEQLQLNNLGINLKMGSIFYGWVKNDRGLRVGILDQGLYIGFISPYNYVCKSICIPWNQIKLIGSGEGMLKVSKFQNISVNSKSGIEITKIKIYYHVGNSEVNSKLLDKLNN